MNRQTTTALSILSGLLLAANASAQDPYEKPDGSYISLSGTVSSSTTDSFVLDYGEGLVTVEMDDWDWYGDAYGLLPEDDVTVYGYVDDDLYETATIEASSVYVDDLNTYYYASGTDEESVANVSTTWYDYDYTVTGEVDSVSGREFTVDTGTRQMTVDTWQLDYNPLDDEGFLKIEKGDRVTVYGDLDMDVFNNTEVSAEAIVKLEGEDRSDS